MKIIIIIMAVLYIALLDTATAQPVKAKTEKGEEVILNSDGTWKFVGRKDLKDSQLKQFSKPKDAKQFAKGKRETYGLWYNDAKWILKPQQDNSNSDAEFQFEHFEGDGWAIIIFERTQISIDLLKDIALQNAAAVAPDAQIFFEEERIVNGIKVLCCKIRGTIDQIPFIYYNYYYAGAAGTIQMITYTAANLIDDFDKDFSDLLNGFEVLKQ